MTQKDYRNGNWYGNSTLSARTIFESVTYNFSELLTSFSIHYEYDPDYITFSGDFNGFNYREIGFIYFGRCFEIYLGKEEEDIHEDIHKLRLVFKKSSLVFFNLPSQLLFLYSNAKFKVNLGDKSFVDGNFI